MYLFIAFDLVGLVNSIESIVTIFSFLSLLIFLPSLYYTRRKKLREISNRVDIVFRSSKISDYDELDVIGLLREIDEIVASISEVAKLNRNFSIKELSKLNVLLNKFFENHFDKKISYVSFKIADIGLDLNNKNFVSKFISKRFKINLVYTNNLIMLTNNKIDSLNFLVLNTKETNEEYECEFDKIISIIDKLRNTEDKGKILNIAFYRSNYSIFKKNLYLKGRHKEKLDCAVDNANTSFILFKMLDIPYHTARLQNNLCNLYILKEEYALAENLINEAIKFYKSNDYPYEYYRALVSLSTIYEKLYNKTNEIDFLHKSIIKTNLVLEFYSLPMYKTQHIVLSIELSRRMFKLAIIEKDFEMIKECRRICIRLEHIVSLNKEDYLYIQIVKANFLIARYISEEYILNLRFLEELLGYLIKLEDFYLSINNTIELFNIYQEFVILYERLTKLSSKYNSSMVIHYRKLLNDVKQRMSSENVVKDMNISEVEEDTQLDMSYISFEFFSL